MSKLRQQSGNAEGYEAAQNQALKLQCMLLEHLRQSGKLGAAAAATAVFDGDLSTGTAVGQKTPGNGQAAAASASGKAASICFDLAEFHRQQHQFDKVSTHCC